MKLNIVVPPLAKKYRRGLYEKVIEGDCTFNIRILGKILYYFMRIKYQILYKLHFNDHHLIPDIKISDKQ
jgi:hypothetical protein